MKLVVPEKYIRIQYMEKTYIHTYIHTYILVLTKPKIMYADLSYHSEIVPG